MRCIKLEKALVWCCWVGNWKLRKKMIFFSCPMIDHLLQGVPTSLEYVCKQYELRLPKNMYFAPKNCFFSLFCELQKWKWLFKAIFFNLLNKLLHNKNCFKKPFSCMQFTKKAEKTVFCHGIHIFRKSRTISSETFLSLRTYSKLVGTPCK